MCGIVAYIGPREAYPLILKGLKRLEYRGYDSSGVALLNKDLRVYKKKGKVAELEDSLVGKDLHAHAGMGHTRWATHGEPNDRNAHPHTDTLNRFAIIHNGIIENAAALRAQLMSKGVEFRSETDSEVNKYSFWLMRSRFLGLYGSPRSGRRPSHRGLQG